MRKIISILIFLTILIFTVSGCTKECSWWHKENCDNSCSVDEDCKYSNCCTCLNKDESCVTTRKTMLGAEESVMPECIYGLCKCIYGKCEFVQP